MPVERRANIIAPLAAHVFLSACMPRVYAMASFADNCSPKTQREMRERLKNHAGKYRTETTPIRATGFGHDYALLVYSNAQERAECFAALNPSA